MMDFLARARQTLPRVLLVFAVVAGTPAFAADWNSLVVGQPVADGTLGIGQFSVKLPEGQWTVAAKLEQRLGSQGGATSSPAQLSATVARVKDGAVTGMLTIRTPATTFVGVRSWNDDPCRGASALVVDTMQQTVFMPECFTVIRYKPEGITEATQGYNGQIASWLKQAGVAFPSKAWRVYYAKYAGGDFVHVYAYVPADTESHAAFEAWGRQAAAALQAMVTRGTSQAVLPPLP
ncbi:MAG: hypothetical protein V4864_25135 [Pseudomonadota bacterium]